MVSKIPPYELELMQLDCASKKLKKRKEVKN